MFYWNPKRCYRLFDAESRAVILYEIAPFGFTRFLKFLNLILNLCVPLYLYIHMELSWIEFALAFIIFDIALACFEQFVLITPTWAISKIPNKAIVSWQYNALHRRLKREQDKMDLYRKTKCTKCDNANYLRHRCTGCKSMERLSRHLDMLKDAVDAAEARVRSFKRVGVSTPTPVPKAPVAPINAPQNNLAVPTSMALYFEMIEEQCKTLINEQHFDFLISLRKTCKSLAIALKTRPERVVYVPSVLCRKLESLMELLNSMKTADTENKASLIDAVQLASKSITEELDKCCIQVNRQDPISQRTPQEILNELQPQKEASNV